eukprot:sb/3476557/
MQSQFTPQDRARIISLTNTLLRPQDRAAGLAAEKELLRSDREGLNAQAVECPACQKYRPRRIPSSSPPQRVPSSPQRQISPIKSPPGGGGVHFGMSPLSPLNLSNLSNGSVIGATR